MRTLLYILLTVCCLAEQKTPAHPVQRDTTSIAANNDSIRNIPLQEVVITERLVKHKINKDIYVLTADLKKGAAHPYDVLEKLPGISFDNMRNTVSVRRDERTLVTVDGIERGYDYIMSISPERMEKAEVIHTLPGRYSTAGYKYIINIVLKKDHIGYDLNLHNYCMAALTGNNGKNDIANEQPKIQYTYTNKMLNISAGYGFADIKWNYPVSYSKSYSGIADFNSDVYTEKNPNDHNMNRSHNINAGIDWHFTKGQTLSLRSSYSNQDERHETAYRTDNSTEHTKESNGSNDLRLSMIYRADIKDKWNVYADISYNIYNSDAHNAYDKYPQFSSVSKYHNKKDYIRGNADLSYNLNDNVLFNLGYNVIWNRYRSRPHGSKTTVSENNDTRHNIYSYTDFMIGQKAGVHAGAAVSLVRSRNLSDRRTYCNILPLVQLNYMPTENVRIEGELSATMEYPKLYQLSSAGYSIDSYMTFAGNQLLQPAKTQSISVQATLWDKLAVGATYEHTKNYAAECYSRVAADKFRFSYENSKYDYLALIAMYDWSISKYLTWRNSAQLSYDRIAGNSGFPGRKHYTNLSFDSRINYWCHPLKLWMTVRYSRNMTKEPQLQGMSELGQDLWQASLQKGFWNNRLYVSLSYIPPFKLGIRDEQRKLVKTDFYSENRRLNLHTYDNMLMIRAIFKLSKGRKAKPDNLELQFYDENKKGKGLL